MPRGGVVNWTREELETVEVLSGSSEVGAFAEKIGIAPSTIYSVKKRIRDDGIDGILAAQAHRNENYTHGGGAKAIETLDEQLQRVYNITAGRAGRGNQTQFTVTLPKQLGEQWVAKFGRQIRFVPTEEGVLILPVVNDPLPEIPAWLNGGSAHADA